MEFTERVQQFIDDNHLLRRSASVVAAVSGGADSVCMMEILWRLGYRVTVVHVQHHLRENADKDAAFVAELAAKRGLLFIRKDVFVAERVAKTGESVEDAARNLRHEALLEVRDSLAEGDELPEIALAHHENDLAETVLFNMIRGTGLAGLAGIPVKRGPFIRPLLFLTRAEIEDWLRSEGIPWRTDETNAELRYSRNRIRAEVLPALEKIRPDAAEKIAESASIAREAADYLDLAAKDWLDAHGFDPGAETPVLSADLKDAHPALRVAVIRAAFRALVLPLKDVGRTHFKAIDELLEKEVGKSLTLPAGTVVKRTYEGLVFTGNGVAVPEGAPLPALRIRTFPYEGQKIPETHCIQWFDYDKILGTPEIRFRRSGDLISTAAGTRKKLKDWMIDVKIPQEMRDRVPLVALRNEILWVPGYRRGETGKISAETKTVLEISIEE